jgi:hypothetical protein
MRLLAVTTVPAVIIVVMLRSSDKAGRFY